MTRTSVRPCILATAGHVDHGKSALIQALTHVDPDRLPEEKSRGITIDLGFAHLDLASGNEANTVFRIGIIDVPGHEDFVKNMVAGVGSIDAALIVVAADDGWMPQTEEHVQILSYLGVARAVIALTKCDLPEADLPLVTELIREETAGTPFANSPIVPTSSLAGTGLDDLRSALADMFAAVPSPADIGKPRLPIDRVFTLKGIGTIVTGTLTGGVLEKGQSVIIEPGALPTRIRTLQSHNQKVDRSSPGTRTAINLPDVGPATDSHPDGVRRGQVVTLGGLQGATTILDAQIERSARLESSQYSLLRPLKHGARVRIHLGSGHTPAKVFLIDRKDLLPGRRSLAQLRLEEPVFAFEGDHFIIRDWPETATLAGGIVLEHSPSRRNFRKASQREFLSQRAATPHSAQVWLESLLKRDKTVDANQALRLSRFSATDVEGAAAKLESGSALVRRGSLWIDAEEWARWLSGISERVDAEHKQHPERPGLSLTELRNSLPLPADRTALFDALITDLTARDFARKGNLLARESHQPQLPASLKAAGEKVRSLLEANPIEPPSRKELTPDENSRVALQFLLDTDQAVEVGDELVLLATAYQNARNAIIEFLKEHQQATISDLRQALGTSRRIIMPILDEMDAQGITVRKGDHRCLGK